MKQQGYERFHRQLQKEVDMYLDEDGVYKARDKKAEVKEYLLLVPNLFLLLYNLFLDERVSGENKVILTMALAYFILPLDFLPELFLGPLGYLDDLVVGMLALDRILNYTPIEVVRENWRGKGDVLFLIQNVLKASQGFLGENVLKKIRDFFTKKKP